MKKRSHDFARPSGVIASMLLAVLFACEFAGSTFVTRASASQLSTIDPRIVQVPRALDADADRVNDDLERAVDKADYKSMPYAVMQGRSALAINKGVTQSVATVVDVIIAFNHAPTAADIAAIERLGFSVKSEFSHTMYGVHAIGPVPAGSQSLRNLANAAKGIVYIEPNNLVPLALENSTRQIGARQSWPVYENYNQGLPLTGDPDRSIAIMDTGLDGTHPDLNGGTASAAGNKIMAWYDAVYGSTVPSDTDGHGSHVAGIAAGTGISSNMAVENGLDTGTGFLPLTLRAANYSPLVGYTESELNNDNIPINTTGFTGAASLTLEAYWSSPQDGTSFGIWDQTNGTDNVGIGAISASGGSSQPAVGTFGVPVNTVGDYFANFTSTGTDYMGYAIHILAPETAVGDGFNLMCGVAPTSSLIGVEVGDPITGALPTSAIMSGIEFLSINQVRDNIGVVNMSFGESAVDPVLDGAVDNLVNQGIVCCVAAGNSRSDEAAGAVVGIGSPASASAAIAVAAIGNVNQISDYSSYGATGQLKPDVSAPGGSYPFYGPLEPGNISTDYTHDEAITSVDSNTNDSTAADPGVPGATAIYMPNMNPNSYTDDEGTSMASPHVAGAVALLEQALSMRGALAGETWSGGPEALLVKALLEMTSSDTNVLADGSTGSGAATSKTNPTPDPTNPSPVIGHLGRDVSEGFGKINVDAALSAVLNTYVPGDTVTASLGQLPSTAKPAPNPAFAKMAFAENVTLTGGTTYVFTTTPGTNDLTGSEFDLVLYSGSPTSGGSISNGAIGDPVALATSNTLASVAQQVVYTPTTTETDVIVVKWQSGAGSFTLASGTLAAPPTGTGTVTPTSIAVVPAPFKVVSQSSGAVIPNALVTVSAAVSGQQVNTAATSSLGLATATLPASSSFTATASALGYYSNTVSLTTGSAASALPTTIKLTPSHEFTPGLQMISVPYEYSATLQQETSPSISTAAVWQPAQDGYVLSPSSPADQFHIGQGYWVRFRQNTSLPLVGAAISGATFSIPLSAGWNMVGCPFTNSVPLVDATVSAGGISASFANAVSANEISVLYGYDSATNAYDPVSASGTMTPYVGYWIYSTTASTLTINTGPPPPPA